MKAIIILVAILAMFSCRSVRYVPVETVKHDSVIINKIQHDSIYSRDSVYLERANDTVFLYKYKYLYKYKNLTDTMYVTRRDSIQVPYPVEVVKTKYRVPGVLWGVVIMLFALSVPSLFKIIKRFKPKI